MREALGKACEGYDGVTAMPLEKPVAARSSMDDVIDLYKRDVDITLIDECLRRTIPERMQALQNALTAIEELREGVARAKAKSR